MVKVALTPRDERFQEQIENLRSVVLSDLKSLDVPVRTEYDWIASVPVCTIPDIGDDQLCCLGEIAARSVCNWEKPVMFLPRGFMLYGDGSERDLVLKVRTTQSASNMLNWLRHVSARHAGSAKLEEPMFRIAIVPAKLPRDIDEIMIIGKPATQCRGWDLMITRDAECVYSSQGADFVIGSDRK